MSGDDDIVTVDNNRHFETKFFYAVHHERHGRIVKTRIVFVRGQFVNILLDNIHGQNSKYKGTRRGKSECLFL